MSGHHNGTSRCRGPFEAGQRETEQSLGQIQPKPPRSGSRSRPCRYTSDGVQPRSILDEAQDRYTAGLRACSRSAVWLTGCQNRYLNASGNNAVMWPRSTVGYSRP